jgi:mono/diheme cytochrome c family protein
MRPCAPKAQRAVIGLLGLGVILLVLAAVPLTTPVASAGGLTPTPTVDRLAAPPTVAFPNQADEGAQLYWLHCQPCHGDRAQGLTDEWRAQYPPEDRNCWDSGCHGQRPYENGFKLPTAVPALVGPGTLTRYPTAAELYAFVSNAMPYQAPGSLRAEEYWAITAFLLRAHGLPDAALPVADAAEAAAIPLGTPSPPDATTTPAVAQRVIWLVLLAGVSYLAWRRRRARAR